MKIQKPMYKVKCDTVYCRNYADWSITSDGTMPANNVNLCDKCFRELYTAMAEVIVPKSPTNLIAKNQKRRDV